jgi:lantibiotic modifying enzyme
VQLYLVTGDDRYQNIITEASRYMTIHWRDLIEDTKRKKELISGIAEGLYMGIGGIAMILLKVYQLFQYEEARKGAEQIIEYYLEHANESETGIFWSDNSPLYLDGGILLFLVNACEVLQEKRLLAVIKKGTNHIISNGIRHEDGGLEINHIHFPPKLDEPNFEFGTAGAGYLFGKVYEITDDETYLEAAKSAAKYILSIAVPKEKGYLIPYKLNTEQNLFYLGHCHGPGGTSKLFYQLYKVSNDPFYYDQVLELAAGLESLGAPSVQSPGYWNTLCICCGPAGLFPMYAGMYLTDQNDAWKRKVKEIGEILSGSKILKSNMLTWELAFDRLEPEILTTPAGYLNGTAGIAATLLQLYLFETERYGWDVLVDNPFPNRKNLKKQ